MARLRNTFLTGLAVLVPIAGSLWVLVFLFRFADGLIDQLLPGTWPGRLPGLGLLLSVAVILFTGWLTTNFLGRKLIELSEQIFSRLPFVRGIYRTFRQLVDVLTRADGESFSRVVMLQYPRPGLWSLGLVTGSGRGEPQREAGTELLHVFVPTTPNPTSGYMLLVPRNEAIPLQMTVQEAMRLIISGGAVGAEENPAWGGQAHG